MDVHSLSILVISDCSLTTSLARVGSVRHTPWYMHRPGKQQQRQLQQTITLSSSSIDYCTSTMTKTHTTTTSTKSKTHTTTRKMTMLSRLSLLFNLVLLCVLFLTRIQPMQPPYSNSNDVVCLQQ